MAKVVLSNITGGYDLSKINDNFDVIEAAFNDGVLFRDNPEGEVNTLETDVDVNGVALYNLKVPVNASDAVRKDYVDAISDAVVGIIQDNIDTLETVSDNIDDIITVADNIASVNTVATNIADVSAVAADTININDVAADLTNIDLVAGDLANIDLVAAIDGDVTLVAAIDNDVTAVASVSTDVSVVASQVSGWDFNSSTVVADPTSGKLLFNNAAIASTTQIAISDFDNKAVNISAYVNTWADSNSVVRGTLVIRSISALAIFSISNLVDNIGWTRLDVSYITHNGSFANTDPLFVVFVRTGDKGSDGLGAGDVVGPVSSTNNSLARFNGTTGKLLKDGAVIGTDVQAYDVDTAKYDDATANFTGALQKSGSAVLVASDVGTSVQAYDVDTAKLDVEQTWGQVQRTNENIVTSLTLDLDNTYLDFRCTPSAGGALTFSNIPASPLVQKGTIVLINGSNYAITAHANTKVESTTLAKISLTGTYELFYRTSNGVVYVTASGALA